MSGHNLLGGKPHVKGALTKGCTKGNTGYVPTHLLLVFFYLERESNHIHQNALISIFSAALMGSE